MGEPALSRERDLRVLIVDDSAFMRRAIGRILERAPGITVIGEATNGVEGVQQTLALRPDVITMDVEMPKMNGVSAVAEIMKVVPTPIVMLSTLTTAGAETTIAALEAGAIDYVGKPSGLSHELANVGEALTNAVLHAPRARLHRPLKPLPRLAAPPISRLPSSLARPSERVLIVGASTGGPPALTRVIPQLPADLDAGVIVVQHMPAGFTDALARRLDSLSGLHVKEAANGDIVAAGTVLVAPGNYHLDVTRERRVKLHQAAAVHGVRPSVDVTLQTVAAVYGASAVVAILTGMGRDGADGAARVEQAGGTIVVQDEATCVVYGMPKAAHEATRHPIAVPLDDIAGSALRAIARTGSR